MRVIFSNEAIKQYKKLPISVQKKTRKQLLLLANDRRHPSLYTKKMKGYKNEWEMRIDLHYRASFRQTDDGLIVDTMGMHDEGLGKK